MFQFNLEQECDDTVAFLDTSVRRREGGTTERSLYRKEAWTRQGKNDDVTLSQRKIDIRGKKCHFLAKKHGRDRTKMSLYCKEAWTKC